MPAHSAGESSKASTQPKFNKKPRLPTLRPSHLTNQPTNRLSKPLNSGISNSNFNSTPTQGETTSWISTVKNRLNNSNMMFEETKLVRVANGPPDSVEHASAREEAGNLPDENLQDTRLATDSPSILEGDAVLGTKLKRKRVYTAKSRLEQWIELRDSTLDELLRHDGTGAFSDSRCCSCGMNGGQYFRCRDCGHGTALLCQTCLVSNHEDLPLHSIEYWNGDFFEKSSLSYLGLRIQLGHDGSRCPCPEPGPLGFTVFSVTGAHLVNIDYCGCISVHPPDRRIQLLRMQWFPATTIRPHTAFTFSCLDTFHESTLQGKGNLYDYYNMLLRRTDNANLQTSIYRFPEIHRAFRLWRNLMAWKRAGRGQDPSGIDGTSTGGLTVECPACPHPGRNLPENWKDAGPLLFLYTLFIAVDANFKLKGKDRKLNDVDLVPGKGVFVNKSAYQNYIADYIDQPEMNTCRSEHDAIVRASIRSTPGYAVSGVGLVLCARHSIVRKNGVGDLQKGERYCNMDFIILSALLGVGLLCIFITYDIACQWSKNLQKRMINFPAHMRIPSTTKIQTAIPSWHINGHGPSCRENFCLGYTKGVGRTCGEEVETNWSHTNPLAASVREMAPAARRDALNDHWNGWNFCKTVGLKAALSKKFTDAVTMQKKSEATFVQMSASFKPALVKQWSTAVENWEKDPTKPNPYNEPTNTVTLNDVRLELTKEEAAEARLGKLPPYKVSMSGFLVMGLDLEEQQYKLRIEITNKPTKKRTTRKQADGHEKRTVLLRRIHNWRQAQLVYTPHVATLIATSATQDENGEPRVEMAENLPLFMPSALPPHVRSTSEMKRICDMERSLRKAAADDALFEIRRGRRNLTKLWKYKKVNVSGTGNRPNTRMLTVYHRVAYKIEQAAHKYRRARAALLVLDPEGSWKENLKELQKEDVRGPGKDPNDLKTANGKYEESWIWVVQRGSSVVRDEEKEFNEDMRVEWAKSRARMMRWQEEYMLVQEEMRRVLEWYEWRASWWEKQVSLRSSGSIDILRGVSAYAHKQAYIARQTALRCASEWLPLLKKHGVDPEWEPRYALRVSKGLYNKKGRALTAEIRVLASTEEIFQGDDVEIREGSEDEEDEEEEEEDDDDDDDEFDFDD